MKKLIRLLKTTARVVLALALLAGMGLGGYHVFLTMASLQKEVIAALLTAIGVAAAALLSKRAEGRHAVKAQFRNQKAELYIKFLREFDKLSDKEPEDEVSDQEPAELVSFLKEMKYKLLVWGSPEVVSRFFDLASVASQYSPGTIGNLGKSMAAWGNLILAMRNDLGLSNRSLSSTALAVHANLQQPDLFLQSLKDRPHMTDEDYREIEQEANARTNSPGPVGTSS